jgi:hypothetical protein
VDARIPDVDDQRCASGDAVSTTAFHVDFLKATLSGPCSLIIFEPVQASAI